MHDEVCSAVAEQPISPATAPAHGPSQWWGPCLGAGLSIPDSLRSIHLNSRKDAASEAENDTAGVNIRVLVPLTCNENCKDLFTNWGLNGTKESITATTQTVTLSQVASHQQAGGSVHNGRLGEGMRGDCPLQDPAPP